MQAANQRLGAALVILSGIFWGTNGPTVEHLVGALGFDIYSLITWRFLCAGALMLAVAACFGELRADIFKNRRDLFILLAFSISGILFAQVFYFYAVTLAGSATATVIQYSAPAIVALIICAEERRAPRFAEVAAFCMVLAGAFLLVTAGDFSKLAISPIALLCCIICTIGAVGNALIPRRINAIYGPSYMLALAMLACGLAMLALRPNLPRFNSLLQVAEFAQIVVFGTAGAFGCYMIGLLKVGAARAAVLGSGVPLVAALLGYFWHGASMHGIQWLGFALILFAILARARG